MSEIAKPYPVQLRGSALARLLLRLAGWRVDFNGLPSAQGVVVVYPHTSNWDFVLMIMAKWAVGLQATFWGKDTLFDIPLFGRWLRWVGGVPVVRNSPRGVVGQAVDLLQERKARGEFCWLGLSPEGTRKRTDGWRSGFYQTALQAKVPLGIVSVDYPGRVVRVKDFMYLSGDEKEDYVRIRATLQDARGKIAANAAPIQPIERQ
jgi:1-acyl-sn-glycerol-3-phosphate acyltransferase